MAPVPSGSCRADSLEWFAPDDARERQRLSRWCAGVGAPAVDSMTPQGPSTVEAGDLTFVSWNVHVGHGDVRRFVRDLRSGTLTGTRKVEHFVLMLQEVVRTTNVPIWSDAASGARRIGADSDEGDDGRDIVGISLELGLSLVYVPSMRNGRSVRDPAEDRGSAILSTVRLTAPVAIELPGERQRRVAIFSKTGAVTVGVAHLDALGGARRLWMFWTPWMRDVQARAMTSILPEGPLVIGADLNTWHGSHEASARLLTAAVGDSSAERRRFAFRELDYLIVRVSTGQRVEYRRVDDRYGSDHRPLVGWIE
jgi:hypothetical protein